MSMASDIPELMHINKNFEHFSNCLKTFYFTALASLLAQFIINVAINRSSCNSFIEQTVRLFRNNLNTFN